MSWKQISAEVKLPKNQLQFKKAANQIEGTSWPEPLKNESKYFCFDPGYDFFVENICILQM